MVSREDVRSLREYATLGTLWKMVRRTAFTELKRSWFKLAGALAALAVMFVAPPLLLLSGAALTFRDPLFLIAAVQGMLAWGLMAWVHRAAPRFFGLSEVRAWTVPLAGALYALMTLDSAVRGGRKDWR